MKKTFLILLTAIFLLGNSAFTYADTHVPISHGDLAAPSVWARDYVEKADRIGMTKNFKVPWGSPVTRMQFCQLAYRMLDRGANILRTDDMPSVFSDTDNPEVLALYYAGIIQGKSQTVFAPNETITREEAAVVLQRIAEKTNLTYTELFYEFDDLNAISSWAENAVQVVCNLGVMQGVGNQLFAPGESYTVEQAIATLIRLFERISDDSYAYLSFTDKLLGQMPNNENYVISPISLTTALSMVANGAAGITQQEILNALNMHSLSAINREMSALCERYSRSEILKMNIANGLWINSDKTTQKFQDAFQNTVTEYYSAKIGTVTDNNGAQTINRWVREQTDGKISEIVEERNADFWSLLVNAVYFSGKWQNPFSESQTALGDFTTQNGTITQVPFMHRTGWINYGEIDGVTVVELPYQTIAAEFDESGNYTGSQDLNMSVSMYLVLGDEIINTEQLFSDIQLKNTYVSLSVPKFQVEYAVGCNDILNRLGIKRAFSPAADFREMYDSGSMQFGSILHKTYICVDEEGTEAAAVTGVSMGGDALPPEPIAIAFDKPFTFVIRDNHSGYILFVGRYVNP